MQGYTDEPIGKILSNIANSDTVLLDRWNLKVEPNPDASDSSDGKDSLPLSVVNNYFSLGVDAHIALEFHEARGKKEATDCVIKIAEKFNYLDNLFHHQHKTFFFLSFLLSFLGRCRPFNVPFTRHQPSRPVPDTDIMKNKKSNLSFCAT